MKQNSLSGILWIEKAASAGNGGAQWAMHRTYKEGLHGKKKDPKRTEFWLRRYQNQ